MNDFGPAVKRSKGNQGGSRVVYKSQYLDDHEFKFSKVANSDILYECEACDEIKKRKVLDCHLPTIKVVQNRIVEIDPETPKHPHFCLGTDQVKLLKKRMKLGQRRTIDTADIGSIKKPRLEPTSMSNSSAIMPIEEITVTSNQMQESPTRRSLPSYLMSRSCFSPTRLLSPSYNQPLAALVETQQDQDIADSSSIKFNFTVYPFQEMSLLTRKVQFPYELPIDEDRMIQLPCADNPIPAKKMEDLRTFKTPNIDIRAFRDGFSKLENEFITGGKTILMIVDSLFHALDDVVISNAEIVRAEFPIHPSIVAPCVVMLTALETKLSTVIYALGFDLLIRSIDSSLDHVASSVAESLKNISQNLEGKKLQFVTIPETGEFKRRFTNFNRYMRNFIRSENMPNVQILDWANFTADTYPEQSATVDRRLKLFFDMQAS